MRRFNQFVSTVLALLIAMPQAYAVDLSTTPIGARTQATPNMIFGLDDSGSTDDEVLLSTSDGALWYENATSSFWNSAGVMNPNSAYSFSTHKEFDYLFPNGSSSSSTSDKRRYGDSSSSFAITPIPTYAFLRSSNYNPLYYDRTARYTPWPAAYISGSVVTF
ncbi:MAG: pyrrolo-quinoline quinone, partial [Burkholderiales bacterium]